MQKSNLGRCRLWSGGGQKQQTREKRSMAKKSETQGFPTFSKVTDDDKSVLDSTFLASCCSKPTQPDRLNVMNLVQQQH